MPTNLTDYEKLTDKQHILKAPDTYIGSVEEDTVLGWNVTPDAKMVYEQVQYIPGLYKLFDESIVNARDHHVRMTDSLILTDQPVKQINVTIDKETGEITVMNDGNGIDVAMHPEHKLWIPEMIFGHLRTSTNYNSEKKRIVGGKNGFGFKLVLIYSLYGRIETVDHVRGLKYVQEFHNNLDEISKPKITKCKGKPYTKVSFIPDFKRFGVKNLSTEMFNIMRKRTYDIGAVTDKSVKVTFNNEVVPYKTFQQYVNAYIGDKDETPRVYENQHERWEYTVCISPLEEFTQVSFVNGINTCKGGTHVNYISNQIVKKLVSYIESKKKVKVKASVIREQLMVILNCVIENPAFDSQSKEYLNTPQAKFGSSVNVSDKFIEKLAKMGIMKMALSLNEVKQSSAAKKSDGKKSRTIRGIPKLVDANYAGGAKSNECTLILCEGDSAKSGIISGLSREDRNTIGVYPLKGKPMNVRDVAIKKITENVENSEIKQILGLESGKKYTPEIVSSSLRYGKVLIMTDQDLDGVHIKGLCINLFHTQWKELIQVPKFIGFMNTPIIKAKKGNSEIVFYNQNEYDVWKKSLASTQEARWKIKYYKGLGTSTGKEFKEYFAHKRIVNFEYVHGETERSLDLLFDKHKADERKIWLSETYDKASVLDTSKSHVSFTEFVHLEAIHFSKYDCERSIPNGIDGLKTSQRKILYAALKRNLTSEIKVAQFAGYVSEHSLYHHGEASLNKAIVSMAQEYTGSNNISLLQPNGQFGTRLQGGKDSASERYIYTQLNPLTKYIFKDEDLPILNYLNDDGTPVEPEYYIPIIPMILVNGSKGIGTGFSTEILSYNPVDIVKYIQAKNKGSTSLSKIMPYYEGFNGDIYDVGSGKFLFKVKYEKIKADTIRVTELPIGVWTQDFKENLEKLMNTDKKGQKIVPIVKEYNDMSTDTQVEFIIELTKGMVQQLEQKMITVYLPTECNELEKILNLYTTRSTTNLHIFNNEQKICKYTDIRKIIDDYIPIRIIFYEKRKAYMIDKLRKDVMRIKNKARFIREQCEDVIDLRRKKDTAVTQMLEQRKYDKIDDTYKYLTSMPISSVIEENIDKLEKECCLKEKELSAIIKKTEINMWNDELVEFLKQYEIYCRERQQRLKHVKVEKKGLKKKKKSLNV